MGDYKRFKIPLLIFFVFIILSSFFLKNKRAQKTDLLLNKFQTLPQEFILIGDVGVGNEIQYTVANSVKNHCATKNCRAVFVLGDVIYDKGVESVDDPQFDNKFEIPYKEIDLPFFILYGNHDYLGCQQCYLDYAKKSKKWEMPNRYYKLERPKVTFFALDTENFDSEQDKWLSEELKKNTPELKIILGHKPIKTFEETKLNENWKGKSELKKIICNLADYYISGHSHILEDPGLIEGCKVKQLISGSAGAYPRKVKKPYEGNFYIEESGFLSFVINEDTLNINFHDKNGSVVYEVNR